SNLVEIYFSASDDLDSILASFPQGDENLLNATQMFSGLRLLTQDPWECLISFVCSINCNIPSIKLKIENLSRRFGDEIESGLDCKWYSFPSPRSLARAEKRELLDCKVGFRWKYIKFIAKKVETGDLDLEKLSRLKYQEALSELISEISGNTFGVGPKVADCVLLYALHKTEAFPIDVWILRCLKQYYRDLIKIRNCNSLTPKTYFELSELMREKFGSCAGYAQLFLYAKMRHDAHATQGRSRA
ncbi:MAG: DNA glycosylase, partial [Nitrososphaerales archaeon]